MKTIIRKELQILLKDKGTFFWLVILPIAFIVLFSSIFGVAESSTITIHYIDQDQSQVSAEFIHTIDQIDGFTVVTDTHSSLEDQQQKIKSGNLSSLVVLPKGFGDSIQSHEQAEIDFYRTSTSDQTNSAIAALLNNIINSYKENSIKNTLSSLGQSDIQINQIMTVPVTIDNINLDVHNISATTQVVPGMMVMFVFFILISMIKGFVKERESGMLARLRSTPMKPINYLAGMWVSFIITVLIQCMIILGFGYFVYHLHVGNLFAILLIVLALSICATGIGLALSFLVKSEQQGVAFTQIIVMGGAALGGLWFPFELLPPFAQKIAHFLPQYWAQIGLQDVMVRGVNITGVLINVVILLLFGVVGLIIASLRFKRYIISATS